ncbi:MAG: pantetheine-phosphate adenylyltransferase [Muribaculaceae bacterium]|nr:pantetheine-phosphate adenylyltransferase [Muribaculaceae bacterium]
MATAIFAGSFDPFTIGHADIVERGLRIFDKVIIAIGYNEHKKGMVTAERRCATIAERYAKDDRINVITYQGLTVDLVKRTGADAILRGARSGSDFEFERNLADTNRAIAGVETVILVARPEYAFVSSSMVRELIHNGYDAERFVAVKDYH